MENIIDIRKGIWSDLDYLFSQVREKSEENYYLLLANADDTSGNLIFDFGRVLDSEIDNLVDKTRLKFCYQYMNLVYKKGIPDYSSDEGFLLLNMELLIYMQIWESTALLKKLVRIVHAYVYNEYLWQPNIPENGKWNFMNKIWRPLVEHNITLGNMIQNSFSSYLRNAVAHAEYHIEESTRNIILYDNQSIKKGKNRLITSERFQEMFLYSVELTHELFNFWTIQRKEYARQNNGQPIVVHLPTGGLSIVTALYYNDKHYRFCMCQ